MYRCYDVLEGQLAKTGGASILQGGVTAVDLHWYPWMRQSEYIGLELATYPRIRGWLERIGALKEVQAAYDKIMAAAVAEGAVNTDKDGKILGADASLIRAVKEEQN